MSRICAILSCPERYPRLEADNLACDRCVDDLDTMLREIGDHLIIVTPARLRRPAGRGGPGYGPASPANDDAIALLDPRSTLNGPLDPDESGATVTPAAGIIRGWAQLVAEAHPASVRAFGGPNTLLESAELLRAHTSWIARQGWVVDAVGELRVVNVQLQRAVGDQPPKPIAKCIEIRGELCEGPVHWSEKPRDEARCQRCKRIYAGLDLARLRAAQEAGPRCG